MDGVKENLMIGKAVSVGSLLSERSSRRVKQQKL